jgi:hypothetical protein
MNVLMTDEVRRFVLCIDCLATGNAMFYHALEGDQITVTRDVSRCRYRETQKAIFQSNSDPFNISEIVENRHMEILRRGLPGATK